MVPLAPGQPVADVTLLGRVAAPLASRLSLSSVVKLVPVTLAWLFSVPLLPDAVTRTGMSMLMVLPGAMVCVALRRSLTPAPV